MFNNPLAIIAAVEIAVALLFLIGCLLFFIRGQKRTLGALEEKIIALRDALRNSRAEAKAARLQASKQSDQSPGDFGEMVEAQLTITRNHHLALSPDRDIVLDIGPDTPLERRAVSLRHAFLIAEKEAWLAAEGKEIDWDVLSAKLAQIIQFYEQPASLPAAIVDVESDMFEALEIESAADFESQPTTTPTADSEELTMLRETIANQQRQIDNLARFKTLFFAADDKWRAANEQAQKYHELLLQKSQELGADADYQALLEKYGRTYDDLGQSLAAGRGDEQGVVVPAPHEDSDSEEPSVGRIVIANQEEIQRLRNMAVDQHKMILRLREELTAASSSEDRERVIAELHKQLERHERFLKESDLCTKQLEDELDRVLHENQSLKMKLQDTKRQLADQPDANVEQMVKIIEDFTEQSCEMLSAIEVLENECRELKAQLAASAGQASDSNQLEALQRELAAIQKELLALQTEHIDLEERYLEMKLKAV